MLDGHAHYEFMKVLGFDKAKAITSAYKKVLGN